MMGYNYGFCNVKIRVDQNDNFKYLINIIVFLIHNTQFSLICLVKTTKNNGGIDVSKASELIAKKTIKIGHMTPSLLLIKAS